MKQKSLIILILAAVFTFCFYLGAQADTLKPESNIAAVTVYPGSAHIRRVASLKLEPGQQEIVLDDIIPEIDENSLNVKGQGQAKVKIFGAYINRDYIDQPADERVKDLEAQIESIDDKIRVNGAQSQVLDRKVEFLDSIKLFADGQIPKDLVTSMPSPDTLQGTLEFLSNNSAQVEQDREKLVLEKRSLKKEREVLRRKLSELRSPTKKLTRSIVVDVGCETAGKFDLEVSYLVRGANWRSVYDARADIAGQKIKLTAYGIITQNTGEDWNDVELTLSTARPNVNGRLPKIDSWLLREYTPPVPIQARRRFDKAKTRLMVMNASVDGMAPRKQEIMDEEEELKEAENVYAQSGEKGVSVTYTLARKVTIKSDGSENKFPVAAQELAAQFNYSSYPRLSSFAYLGSKVKNSSDLQLLAGQVNLFLADDFVGKSSIDMIGPGEEFDLYLGIDENVKVERELVQKKVDDVLIAGIPSPNKVTTYRYKLKVENYKKGKILVKLYEAVPVSQNDRIRVKTFDIRPKPSIKNFEDKKGVWLWEFGLKPSEKKEISYGFAVEHPRDMKVEGL